jgi:hypothetical protein
MLATITLSKFKDSISPVVNLAYQSIKNLVSVFNELPTAVKSLGLLGFLMLGSKGKLVALAIGAVIKDLEHKVGVLVEKFAGFNQKILEWRKKYDYFIDQEEIDLIQSWNDEMFEMAENMKKPLDVTKKLNDEIEEVVLSLGDFGEITEEEFNKMSKDTQALIMLWKKLREEVGKNNIFEQQRKRDFEDEQQGMEKVKVDEKKILEERLRNYKSFFIDLGFEQDRMLDKQIGLSVEELKAIESAEQKKIRLKEEANKQITDNSRDTLSALSGMNRTAFEAYKRFQIAEATINAISGAATAFKTFAGNPWMATFVAASHLAKGMAMVAQIQSTSYRQQGGMVKAGQPYMVGEAGKELFVPNQSGKIVPNHELGQPVNVNFNITTVDASGFNQLLNNSRGTIVNMINSAVNETGRQAIV